MEGMRDETIEDGTEPETDNPAVDLGNPDILHLATVSATIGEAGLVLTLACSCGMELASAPGKLGFKAINTEVYQHGMAVMSARLDKAMGPLIRALFGDS